MRIVKGKNAEVQNPAPEQRLAKRNLNISQLGESGRHRHSQVRHHLLAQATDISNPVPEFCAAGFEGTLELERDDGKLHVLRRLTFELTGAQRRDALGPE